MSRETIGQAAPQTDTELLNKINSLFDELAHGRFASAQKGRDQMQDVYNLADEVITKFEKVKKK